jgi:hypothetical protein
MKKYTPILLVIISLNFHSCTQNENWEELLANKDSPIHQYDIDFIKYIAEEEIEEEFKNQEKFNFLNSFYLMFKIKDESLLESDYMIKPNKNELLALYLGRKIGWNSFNRGISKKSKKALVFDELINFPSPNELLSFYYSEIFIQVLNKKDTYSPNEINLDYEELELSKEQGDIMFLTAMRHCGNQINSFSETRFPDNCFRQTSFISKLPKFNGVSFDKYQLNEFDDFLIHVDKRYPKTSFKERYLPELEGAKSAYIKCQKAEKVKGYMDKEHLIDGKWLFPIALNCVNYYEFTKDSVRIFDCEIQEKTYGTYEINLSQVIIHTRRDQYNDEFPKESKYRHEPMTIELRIDENMLVDDKYEMEYIKIK